VMGSSSLGVLILIIGSVAFYSWGHDFYQCEMRGGFY
jgi:hypothetical protein